ncbi:sugar transferase [Rhodovulum sp. FJ3]|uniref:sugar transferase n=1 Tax=Rhodovulum sp. FJ3 TaxID=3079053 RepID=UPI00293DFF48|nr:sugar transferase [Rhodovulum sp. FJ3]MDV4167576.1 sugar transferase [Rhodovulum sp. FJ3]
MKDDAYYDLIEGQIAPFPTTRPSKLNVRSKRSFRTFYFATKRVLDIFGAVFGLLLIFPLLIGVALAIKINSRGPVFFRQERYGLNGELFRIYKFRTMYSESGDATGVKQTTSNDNRVTPVGAFLRRTSIDELPQLINVLNGTMSFVGPRPHVPNMLAAGVRYEDFDRRYMYRHGMLPGITGLAQVNGYRGPTSSYEAARGRLELDLEYIRTASLYGDFKILVKTIAKELLRGGSGH